MELPIDGVLDLHTFQPREVKDLVPDYTTFSLRLHYSGGAGKEGHAEAIPLEPT